jgi:hypothetical protein
MLAHVCEQKERNIHRERIYKKALKNEQECV